MCSMADRVRSARWGAVKQTLPCANWLEDFERTT
jgi:hypothetical protein